MMMMMQAENGTQKYKEKWQTNEKRKEKSREQKRRN